MQFLSDCAIMSGMELYEANKILRTVKSALSADGYKLPPSADADGLMMLLDRLDPDKFLAQKIKHARSADKNSAAYNRSFHYLAFFRALIAVKNGMPAPVTYTSAMLLHKTVCGDLNADAGKPRAAELLTDGNAHTDPKYIAGSLKSMIAKMNDTEIAPTISKEDFAGYLSHYMRELLIMHPFDRGSDFTLRLFLVMFSKLKGFSLLLYRSTPSAIKDAEDKAFKTDDVTPLYKLFLNCLSYERTTAPSPVRDGAPRTRRELARDLRRPARKNNEVAAVQQPEPRGGKKTASAAKSKEDVLRRAIRLQQKISKLNQQITELIQPLEKTEGDE